MKVTCMKPKIWDIKVDYIFKCSEGNVGVCQLKFKWKFGHFNLFFFIYFFFKNS